MTADYYQCYYYYYYYLNSGFGETDPHSDFFAHKNVWIVGLTEAPFQFVELCRREPGPVSLLFIRLADVIDVWASTSTADGGYGRSRGQPVTGRGGQIETTTRQPERSVTATDRRQLRR